MLPDRTVCFGAPRAIASRNNPCEPSDSAAWGGQVPSRSAAFGAVWTLGRAGATSPRVEPAPDRVADRPVGRSAANRQCPRGHPPDVVSAMSFGPTGGGGTLPIAYSHPPAMSMVAEQDSTNATRSSDAPGVLKVVAPRTPFSRARLPSFAARVGVPGLRRLRLRPPRSSRLISRAATSARARCSPSASTSSRFATTRAPRGTACGSTSARAIIAPTRRCSSTSSTFPNPNPCTRTACPPPFEPRPSSRGRASIRRTSSTTSPPRPERATARARPRNTPRLTARGERKTRTCSPSCTSSRPPPSRTSSATPTPSPTRTSSACSTTSNDAACRTSSDVSCAAASSTDVATSSSSTPPLDARAAAAPRPSSRVKVPSSRLPWTTSSRGNSRARRVFEVGRCAASLRVRWCW